MGDRSAIRAAGIIPAIQTVGDEFARPDAGGRLWHVPRALPDHVVAGLFSQ